jgi:hypothetical protein
VAGHCEGVDEEGMGGVYMSGTLGLDWASGWI